MNHYHAPDDGACDFPGLLEAVHGVPGIERIRFASPHPRHTTSRLIRAVKDALAARDAEAAEFADQIDADAMADDSSDTIS